MSINFNAYGIKTNDMNIADLEVGQHLIRVIRPAHYDSLKQVMTAEYVVVKVLKTRLVLEDCETGNELRLLVDQKKWSIRAGEVTTTREGTGESWNRTAYEFATEDEADLVQQIIGHRAEQVAKLEAKNNAHTAVRRIASELHPNLESVENAIQALQVLADSLRAAQ